MNTFVALGLAFSLLASSAPGLPHRDQEPFDQGLALFDQGKYEESIPWFEKALVRHPEGSNILWNLGVATSAADQHEKALTYWQKYRKLRPEDWQGLPRLIQTLQALGRLEERDQILDQLYQLRKGTTDAEFKKAPVFCREQLRVGGRRVLVYQFFEPEGKWMQFYRFVVTDAQGRQDYFISLGSYDMTTQISRELGDIKEDERMYHFDGYYQEGLHKTFGFLSGKTTPAYDDVRPTFMKILNGEIEASSSSQME